MRKQIYISADYSKTDGDLEVVTTLTRWGNDNRHIINFLDMSQVVSGSVSNNPDCRVCDLKQEFNKQINASSATIFIVGSNTALRTAGSICPRTTSDWVNSFCTPYKQNVNGYKRCKVPFTVPETANGDVGYINNYSYLQHEFEQAKKRNKKIIIVYNSFRKEISWLPSYMKGYESIAEPFWIKNVHGQKIGNYNYIKQELGYV